MKVNCLSCGHKIDIGDAYDDYDGQIKCWVCGVPLGIKTVEGSLKSVRLLNIVPRPSVEEAIEHGSDAG
jgi:hypothetical protein